MFAVDLVKELQNPSGAPKGNYGFTEISWSRKVAQANFEVHNKELAQLIREHSVEVAKEILVLDDLRAKDPIRHAVTSFVFAILSPQTSFFENVLVTRNVMGRFHEITHASDVLECLHVPFRGVGQERLINLGLTKAKYLFDALPWLDALKIEEFTYENIRTHKGLGPKATSMALALFDARNKVFTLDQWMLRLTLALNGHNPRATIRPTDAGYALTEAAWLSFCHESFPSYHPFTVQWTAWNLCFGSHVSHLPIFI